MVTGAALATINRLPVLLLPSDYYATRRQGPVLQQLEHPISLDLSVNDCFRPVSRFFDRISAQIKLLCYPVDFTVHGMGVHAERIPPHRSLLDTCRPSNADNANIPSTGPPFSADQEQCRRERLDQFVDHKCRRAAAF